MILTGTGDWWHQGPVDINKHNPAPFADWSLDSQIKMYYDIFKLLENLIFCVISNHWRDQWSRDTL
jgi:hypothetical protein